MSAPAAIELPIGADDDIVRIRQLVRTKAQEVKLSLVDQTKVVTAASELARNTLTYGGGGRVVIDMPTNGRRVGIRARFIDEGPGIPDLDLALTEGWTSGKGMGLGLSGSRRLVDEFTLDTEVGRGTTVTIVKWSR
ncbi:anti-sigma regulatory factor [Actinokineospora sp. PR83]|uniref:anti-sigma regulatory factor n=1 Tax=Actinokineospora sp. PR83 TaxID=2884908 RepID=UPI0027E1565C|nr:anti-sigma regulatory factor [Actinokineospora sp. PR83]MCG8916554.1 anti-sigma regulatory factor [Actinokineospora sp. PR83]